MSRRSFLRLEAFDERCLPSVTAVLSLGTLQITGDANANAITITDDGTATGVTITVDGQPLTYTTDGSTVQAIMLDAGAGDDSVVYNLTNKLLSSRNTVFNLGTGNDKFTANMDNQGLAPSISLDITAYGQGGKDTLILNAQNFNSDANSILNIDYVGGAGKNTVQFNYSPGLVDITAAVILQNNKK